MTDIQSAGDSTARSEDPVLRYTARQRAIGHAFAGAVIGAGLGATLLHGVIPGADVLRHAAALGIDLSGVDLVWIYAALGGVLGVAVEVPRGLASDAWRRRELARLPKPAAVASVKPRTPAVAAPDAKVAAFPPEARVTRAHAEGFARQPPPRRVPHAIALYTDRIAPQLLFGMGVAFSLAGMFFSFMLARQALASGKGLWNSDWLGAAFALLFIVFGAPMAFYFGRARYRIRRLLRHGRMTTGRIEKVEATDEAVDGVAIGLLTVTYRHDGREVRASGKIVGPAQERAKRLLAAGKPAAILHDPAVPQRILFVDDLIRGEIDVEP